MTVFRTFLVIVAAILVALLIWAVFIRDDVAAAFALVA